jgi:FkbM family methyltransferase
VVPFISYSQNREDVVLHRVFGGNPRGFYIDVGANDPVVASVTKGFYELGWRGINIEPVPSVFERLSADRPGDINLNIGISSSSQTLAFFECESCSSHSTFSREDAELRTRHLGLAYRHRQVPVKTLAEVCAQHVTGEIDFRSIDAEGFEGEVLEGNDWSRWRPKVLVIEDALSPTTGLRNHTTWEPLLLSAGYHFGHFDGINRFYIRGEELGLLHLLQVPANVEDRIVTHETLCLRRDLEIAQAQLAGYRDLVRTEVLARKLKNRLARYPRLYAASKRLAHFAFPGLWKSGAARCCQANTAEAD